MTRTLPAVVLILSMNALATNEATALQTSKGKKDTASLDGTWEGFVVEGKGERPNAGPLNLRLTIKGTKMTGYDIRGKRDLGEGTFQVNRDRKQLDVTGDVVGAGRNRSYMGIYELDGDTLKWAVSNFQIRNRPAELVSRTPGQYLMVLKKVNK